MKIELQYIGFLQSNSLWTKDIVILPKFNFISTTINTPQNIPIKIPDNEVLGKRIEHFFEYYFRSQNQYEVLIKNLQIFKAKITIGELDFLIKDRINNQILHVELVYKFYLYVPEVSDVELEKWIGPNKKDSLPEKLEKLKLKQLPLLFRDETTATLDQLNLKSDEIKQEVCFLANLFIPISYKNITLPLINNKCIIGYWIHAIEFTSLKYKSKLFSIPEKQDWVANPYFCSDWSSYEKILQTVTTLHLQKKSPLLWIKNKEDIVSKLFVVWW